MCAPRPSPAPKPGRPALTPPSATRSVRALLGGLLLLGAAAATASPACAAQGPGDPVLDGPRVVSAEDPPRVALAPLFAGPDGEADREFAFQRAVDARQAPGDPDAWYVVEQRGLVFMVAPDPDGGWLRLPFLDIRESVSRRHNEEGLLGLAFSPHHATPGHGHERAFYVVYSPLQGERRVRLSRLFAGVRGAPADPAGEQVLLEVPQPYGNHNGGGLVFGPDGMLYLSLGDGGHRGDPHDHGQNPGTLLGTILRLDVGPPEADEGSGADAGRPYRVPADNPLVDRPGARPEVFAYGLRNAWRFAFDRQTGELWAGDVGQDAWESVFVVQPGGNHGWNLVEGRRRFSLPVGVAPPPGLVPPVFEYPHAEGLSITGGFVYRGEAIPALRGWYLFADYVTRRLWGLRRRDDGSFEHALLLGQAAFVSSFAEGHDGELVLVDHMGSQQLHRLVPAE